MTPTSATSAAPGSALEDASFEDTFVSALPADANTHNVPRPVVGAAYSFVTPTPVAAPYLIAWSDTLADELGLARPAAVSLAVDILAGVRLASGMKPYAARYGGHQFGNWAGQLGDGRAITLGELVDRQGQRQEIQLKGAGPTPYSRRGDGRAVLRSSIREFLCSEAMHALGIPTTRALSLVTTGEGVVRDMFYDGRPQLEPGAIVCRVAPSFVRFGNFEIFVADAEPHNLRALVDWVIAAHFAELGAPSQATYAAWFAEVCRRTAVLVAHWMRVGFVHGVMNTDNMSILGLTIDYGPYGWLEGFDASWTPNTTDAQGRRYCYGDQPQIAYWNLTRLAAALTDLIEDEAVLHAGLETYRATFEATWSHMLADKLGLPPGLAMQDALVTDLFGLLQATETDMTIFFRRLADVPIGAEVERAVRQAPLQDAFYLPGALEGAHGERLAAWLEAWAGRVREGGEALAARRARMNGANPRYVLRNWMAQEVIDAATTGEYAPIETLLHVLRRPYDEQPEHDKWFVRRPEWARVRPGCSALSCSS
ncbi:MAG: YdiU family protein [Rhodocyclaceae bacterium]